MSLLYNILLYTTKGILSIAQHFSKKLKLFVAGSKQTFQVLEDNISGKDQTIWFHCASLGEFEQGVPVMHSLKKSHPNHKIIVSFFSPSGYENKKNTSIADVVVYLPLDTKRNARRFIQQVHPSLVFFVKYEFWPNYLTELKRQEIKTYLISGAFRKEQLFFKSYGGVMRRALESFDHFFLQDLVSKELLQTIGITNTSVSGDTRFDRVSQQITMDNTLDFIARFKKDHTCIVCGSIWEEDQDLLLEYINQVPKHIKCIIAPHAIDTSRVLALKNKIKKQSVLYSQSIAKGNMDPIDTAQVFIIDTVGLLAKIYSYADIVYVGGGAGTKGLHNILEPATFGVPIVIGKNYNKFPEAVKLRSIGGLFSVENSTECKTILSKLVEDTNFRNRTGMICGHFVDSNTGATKKIVEYLKTY